MAKRKVTTELLKELRARMRNFNEKLGAYIIPSEDAHCSEYLSECDKRRAFISGFTGSTGTAIITHEHACLWTDGRYFLQATEEMDANWTLMKEGIPTTLSEGAWLSSTLPDGALVGVDPTLMSYQTWKNLKTQLELANKKLVPIDVNLIDEIWTDRPARPRGTVFPLELKYTGRTIKDKLEEILSKMKDKNVSTLVLTLLDEIAWFLNLRGSDIEYNPVFFSYVIIKEKSVIICLDDVKITENVRSHLNKQLGSDLYEFKPYSSINDVIKKNTDRVWISNVANYALVSLIPQENLLTENTPIALMKAVKNSTEIQGMRNAHIKDAIALCSYFCYLEQTIGKEVITEVSGAKKLCELRAEQEDFMGPSFATISSVGPHGAIIHYQPSKATDVPLTTNCLYLCDSGGHYKDGTTDVTRTIHLGEPSDYEKKCFTLVLKGQINLGTSIFPSKIKGNYLDSFARQFLWQVGLDYRHGTGHGIGAYLNVHEGPMEISWRTKNEDPGLQPGMFVSNEPGYYEDGKFGVRIEDIVQIVEAETPYNFNNRGFLTFDTITLVPKQIKMIKTEMLTEKEKTHLNDYHEKCREILGPILEKQGKIDVKEWLWRETQPLK